MAHDPELASRLRSVLAGVPALTERAMFGGIGFMVGGNLAIAASSQGGLLVRVEPSQTESILEEPHAETFEMRGRAMNGWVRVAAPGVAADGELERWASIGVAYARSLPPKPA